MVGLKTVKAVLLDEVSLVCELYGYLHNLSMKIDWYFNNSLIGDSNAFYKVNTMQGLNKIQNGGKDVMPSIISILTVLVNEKKVFGTYFCNTKIQFGIFNVVLMEPKSEFYQL